MSVILFINRLPIRCKQMPMQKQNLVVIVNGWCCVDTVYRNFRCQRENSVCAFIILLWTRLTWTKASNFNQAPQQIFTMISRGASLCQILYAILHSKLRFLPRNVKSLRCFAWTYVGFSILSIDVWIDTGLCRRRVNSSYTKRLFIKTINYFRVEFKLWIRWY